MSGEPFWIRVTGLLLLALIVRPGFRAGRARSAIDHAVLVGLVLLPIAAFAPRLPIPCLPAETVVIPAAIARSEPIVASPAVDFEPILDQTPVAVTPIAEPRIPESPKMLINTPICLYFAMTFLFLLRLAGSLYASIRLSRNGVAVVAPTWLEALDDCRNRLKFRDPPKQALAPGRTLTNPRESVFEARCLFPFGKVSEVDLRRTDQLTVPVVVGWPRATILIPGSLVDSASKTTAEAILLHELAHVKRGDFAWNLLLHLVRAFYWPHPLVWLLARSIAVDRERACDALCIHELGGPAAYRDALIAVASSLVRRPFTSIGIAMARTPRLARRLDWIDRNPGDPRCVLGLRGRILLAITTLLVVFLIGTAQATRAEAPASPIVNEPTALQVPGRVLQLQVLDDASGQPIPKARVLVSQHDRGDDRVCDQEGRLSIPLSDGPGPPDLQVEVWGDGFAEQTRSWGAFQRPIPAEESIRLKSGTTLGGIVKDDQGNPIPGVSVKIYSQKIHKQDPRERLNLRAITGPDGRWQTGGAPETTGEISWIELVHPDYRKLVAMSSGPYPPPPSIASLRAGTAVMVMNRGLTISGRVVDEQGRAVAGAEVNWSWIPNSPRGPFAIKTTDADGRFRFTNAEPGKNLALIATARGHGPGTLRLDPDQLAQPIELRLGRARALQGLVVDPNGKPISGARLTAAVSLQVVPNLTLYSDADGRFRWNEAAEGEFAFNIDRRGMIEIHNHKVPAYENDIQITLHRGLMVSGAVFDPEGKAVKAGSIEFGAVNPATGQVDTWSDSARPGRMGVGRGRFHAVFEPLAEVYRIRIMVEGAEPFLSRPIRGDEEFVDLDVHLTKSAGPVTLGVVLRPDGKPLAGARVLRAGPNSQISLWNGQWSDSNAGEQTTGPDGSFAIPKVGGPFIVVILGADGFAVTNSELLAASTEIQAQPFGRVEGEYRVGDKPLANRPIELFGNRLADPLTLRIPFLFSQTVTTDPAGHFVFDRILPMNFFRIGQQDRPGTAERVWTRGQAVDVRPGETTRVVLGGKGRVIVGRLARPDGVSFSGKTSAVLDGDSPLPPPARIFPEKVPQTPEDWRRWMDAYRRSPEVQALIRNQVRIAVGVRPDGTFRFDDVPPGHYRLVARLDDSPPHEPYSDPFASIGREVLVPPGNGTPIDLGTLTFRPHVSLHIGDSAPAVEVTTVSGQRIALDDLRGKFVLLEFGAHYDVGLHLHVAQMRGVFEAFGKDDRLVIVSLICEPENSASRRFLASKQEPWPQAIIGPLPNAIADAFGVEPRTDSAAAFVLIDPDGRVAAKPEFNAVKEAVGKALGR